MRAHLPLTPLLPQVTAWLASFGVTELVSEGSVSPLPELDASEKKRLLTGEPVWAKPALDLSAWKEVRCDRRGWGLGVRG